MHFHGLGISTRYRIIEGKKKTDMYDDVPGIYFPIEGCNLIKTHDQVVEKFQLLCVFRHIRGPVERGDFFVCSA